jgi:protoporphyrinogen/coproporphyrinogen III oxidase
MDEKSIYIVGGGITGLTSAYYLQKKIMEENLPYRVTIVEQSGRLGGKIQTDYVNGFTIEKGPDSFLAKKGAILELVRELGLEQELVGTNQQFKNNYILHRDRLHLMPPGLLLGIPTQVMPFVKTGLISPMGKLRAALDLVIPAKRDMEDEALGSFLKRRLGREVAENIAEPLLSGIYAGDTESLSLAATFPQFQEIERKHGSLIKGMLSARRAPAPAATAAVDLPPALRRSMFLSFKKGLATLVARLVEELDQVTIRLNQGVQRIMPVYGGGYLVEMTNDTVQKADVVILATPAYATQQMLQDVDETGLLLDIPYVSVLNIALSYHRQEIDYPLEGYGFVVPRKEGHILTACTWTSTKWPNTAPAENVLLRCYIGHAQDQSKIGESDERLVQQTREELKQLLGISARPLFARVSRWKSSMPQYQVGHKGRLQQVRAALEQQRPGVYLAGSGYDGVGIPDCITQGKEAAEQVYQFLAT